MNLGEPKEEESTSVEPSCGSVQGGALSRVLTGHFLLRLSTPALRSELGCMVLSVLLQGSGVPNSITTSI